MPDELSEEQAVQKIASMRLRQEQRKQAFLSLLPDSYPMPRAEQEWKAYKELRQWWSRIQVSDFISLYGTEDMWYPGSLDTLGRPSLTEFNNHLNLLQEGEDARNLEEPKMIKVVAGTDAESGFKSRSGGSKGGNAKALATPNFKSQSSELQEDIDNLHIKNPNKSYEWLKSRVAMKYGCSAETVKTYTTNPMKK